MSNSEHLEVAPVGRGKLRPFITELSTQVAALSAGDGAAVSALQAAWATFVKTLDLGDAPDVRSCPSCKTTVLAQALRCDNCWSYLTPAATPA